MGNILKNPHEDKYRQLKKTIPKIQSTLFSLKGEIDALIEALGYTKSGDELYLFMNESTRLLKKGQYLLNEKIDQLSVLFMTPE